VVAKVVARKANNIVTRLRIVISAGTQVTRKGQRLVFAIVFGVAHLATIRTLFSNIVAVKTKVTTLGCLFLLTLFVLASRVLLRNDSQRSALEVLIIQLTYHFGRARHATPLRLVLHLERTCTCWHVLLVHVQQERRGHDALVEKK